MLSVSLIVKQFPELIKYMESPEAILYAELKGLAEKKEVYLLNFDTNKATIAVTSHFSVVYANKFKEILTNHTIPFPLISDLPKLLPHDAIEKETAENLKNYGGFIPGIRPGEETTTYISTVLKRITTDFTKI